MTIKAGDLVMVVKPASCCGCADCLGELFTVQRVINWATVCDSCGHAEMGEHALIGHENECFPLYMLKKIDPPSEGDSLPTRKDMEVPA